MTLDERGRGWRDSGGPGCEARVGKGLVWMKVELGS